MIQKTLNIFCAFSACRISSATWHEIHCKIAWNILCSVQSNVCCFNGKSPHEDICKMCIRSGYSIAIFFFFNIKTIFNTFFYLGLWQRMAPLRPQCWISCSDTLCRWCFIWSFPSDWRLSASSFKNRNSASSWGLLAR